MELLKEIKDREFPQDESLLELRKAARAVLFDENGLVPLLFVSKYNYHKIPGGGIDMGENKLEALEREVLEEVGSRIKVIGEVGKIIEFRSKWNFKQVSYCYLGQVILKGKSNFTEKELSQGFKLMWLPLDEAILKIQNDKPENYEGHFIVERELAFLKKAREMGGLSHH